ncbi:MAG: hypothetical protein SGJ27_05050 [Candidatus Melainabacteria bacterium]|nr:hypothetical protein [Candidatus Melainabacteria bacterium]
MREEVIAEETITDDERRCLRMWFRQAIVQLERDEVANQIYVEKYTSEKTTHREHAPRRKTRRSRMIPHLRELVF